MSNKLEPSIARVVGHEEVSSELRPLLLAVFRLLGQQAEPTLVADAIEELLQFLCSPRGRTNGNCVATDHFFALDEGWGDVGWDYLPSCLGDVLADAAGALHDTVSAPEIAENFDSTPEQLLSRLQACRQEWHVG